MGSIYLIRHGQASFGHDDYDNLSPLGVEQSSLLGQHFKSIGLTFDTVYSGAMKRHLQTASACLNAMNDSDATARTPITLKEFNEYDHEQVFQVYKPEYKNKAVLAQYLASQDNPRKAFQQLFAKAMERWVAGGHDQDYSESWTQFKARCKHGLDSVIRNAKASQNIAVFTSGGPISSNVQQHLNIPDANIQNINWAMVNCSITHFLYSSYNLKSNHDHKNNNATSLNYFNNYAHLQTSVDSPFVTYR